LDVSTYLFQAGKLGPWIALFNQIMQSDENPQPLTEDTKEIETMNKSPEWKLKGIVAQISL
jgi:hypothetical protein